MKALTKRIALCLLAAAMTFTMMPTAVFATVDNPVSDEVIVTDDAVVNEEPVVDEEAVVDDDTVVTDDAETQDTASDETVTPEGEPGDSGDGAEPAVQEPKKANVMNLNNRGGETPETIVNPVPYIERSWNGSKVVEELKTADDYIDMATVSGGQIIGGSKMYVVKSDQTIDGRLEVSGTLRLILMDGAKLTVKGGIQLSNRQEMIVYGQTANTGELLITNTASNKAGIGGGEIDGQKKFCGNFTLNGGKVTIPAGGAGDHAAGIGGGQGEPGGIVVIYGGEATVTGGLGAAGFGGGEGGRFSPSYGAVECFTMYGGVVKATGGKGNQISHYGPGIGTGDAGSGADGSSGTCYGAVGIYGGTLQASAGSCAAAIGGSYRTPGCPVTIRNANVTANGGYMAAGIGGGAHGNGDAVTIENSTVFVSAGSYGQAIGKGDEGSSSGDLTLSDELQVSSGSSASSLKLAKAEDRVNAARAKSAKIEPCKHSSIVCTSEGKNSHIADCSNCKLYIAKHEGHTVEGHNCTMCGELVYQAICDPGTGEAAASYYEVPESDGDGGYKPWMFELPQAPDAPKGKVFSSWAKEGSDASTFDPGETYSLTDTTTFTAVWNPAYKVTYDPNNGYEPSTVTIGGTPDDEGNPTGCGFMTAAKPANAPDGKQFIGWKLGEVIYGENDFVWITDREVTLTAQWSDRPAVTIKAVNSNGVMDGISSLVYPTESEGTTLKDIIIPHEEDIIDHFTGQLPDGYAIYTHKPVVPKLLSEYDNYSEMPFISTNSEWIQPEVTNENNTVYVPVCKIVDEIDIPLDVPECCENTATAILDGNVNYYRQKERPEFTVTEDDPFTIPEIKGGEENYWTVDPESSDVEFAENGYTDGGSNFDAYVMTFRGGHTYQANAQMEFKVGYLPSEELVVKVNGAQAETVVIESFGAVTGDASIIADVAVRHAGTDWRVTKQASCTEAGERTGTCSKCNEQATEPIDPLGHDWSEWQVTTDPTCTEAGTETRSCSRCQETETRPVDSLGHDYQTSVTEPTCTERGYTTHTCSRCGDSYEDTYVDANGHDWDEGTRTKEPTCTEAGAITFTCKNDASHTRTETIDSLGHDYKDTVTAPTCEKRGYTTHTCSRCDENNYEDTYVDALGHEWSDWEEIEGQNYYERVCLRDGCDQKERINIPDADCRHTNRKTIQGKEPTCTEPGYKAYEQCEVCGVYIVGEQIVDADNIDEIQAQLKIEALGHHPVTMPAVDPTCTASGLTDGTKCDRCDEIIKAQEFLPAMGHTEVVLPAVEATCTEAGHGEGTQCSVCGEVITAPEEIPAGHNYETVTTPATLTKDGKIVKTCSKCGDVKTSKISHPVIKLSATSYIYNGKERKPSVTVTGADGKKIASTNYTVSYASGRKNVGKYSVKVTFKGNYSGAKTLSFTIKPAKAAISKAVVGKKQVKVTMSKKPASIGGSAYQVSYRVKGTSKWKTVTTKTQSATIKKLTTGKQYQIRARAYKKVSGKTYYGAWSKVKTTVKIK